MLSATAPRVNTEALRYNAAATAERTLSSRGHEDTGLARLRPHSWKEASSSLRHHPPTAMQGPARDVPMQATGPGGSVALAIT